MSQPGKNLIYPKQFSNIFKVCNKKNNKKIKPHSNHEKRKKKGKKRTQQLSTLSFHMKNIKSSQAI